MKAFVITIVGNEKSEEAADRCIRSGRIQGLEIQKFKAITPKDNPKDIFKSRGLPEDMFEEMYSRKLNCMSAFLSHFSIWEDCAVNDDTYVIFEHDAVLTAPIPTVPFQYCMTISKPSYGKWKTPRLMGANPLTQKEYFGGAHGYMLKPQGAWALIETAISGYARPTDVFLNKEYFPWLQEYYPWICEAKDNFTTIQNETGCYAKHNFDIQNKHKYTIENV